MMVDIMLAREPEREKLDNLFPVANEGTAEQYEAYLTGTHVPPEDPLASDYAESLEAVRMMEAAHQALGHGINA